MTETTASAPTTPTTTSPGDLAAEQLTSWLAARRRSESEYPDRIRPAVLALAATGEPFSAADVAAVAGVERSGRLGGFLAHARADGLIRPVARHHAARRHGDSTLWLGTGSQVPAGYQASERP